MPKIRRLTDKERQEIDAELKTNAAAAEKCLEELAERALSVPAHMIDRVIDAEWEKIREDIGLLVALNDWMEQLLIYDPSFLRHVFEGWRNVLKPRKEQDLSLSITTEDSVESE